MSGEAPASGEPEIRAVRGGGVTLAARRWVPAAEHRPVLVALHGGPGLDHHTLLPLARRLAGQFDLWLPDLPGHGASLPPSGRPPGLEALARQTAAWLRRLPAEVEVLLGHSMGAWLVRELLRRRQLAPRAAVLLSPPAAARRIPASRPGPAAEGEEGRRLARRDLLAHLRAEAGGRGSAEMTAAVAAARLRPAAAYPALLRNFRRALAGPLRPFDPGCPVLVLCGAEDATTPPHEAARVAAATAGARLEVLPDAGHYPFADAPEETAGVIVRFLTAALGSPAGAR